MKNGKWMWTYLAICICALMPNLTDAAEFHVTSASEFQSALTTAEGNSQDDTIYLAEGQYIGDPTWGFRYNTLAGDGAITVKAETGVNPSQVILDGNDVSAFPILTIADQANASPIAVEGITIQNSNSYAAVELVTAGGDIALGDCSIRNNIGSVIASATVDAVGTGGMVTLSRNTITSNTGLVNVSARNIDLTQNTISANTGGGVQAAAETVVLTDNVITNNTGDQGVGVYATTVENGTIYLTNNTITGNQASNRGGGVSVLISSDETVYFYNNIIWGNEADSGGDDIHLINLLDEGEAYSFNNDYAQMSGSWTQEAENINADPLFVNTTGGDWHLTSSSPCVDTGTNEALQLPDTDRDGNQRIFDGNADGTATVDMGAYEYGSGSPAQDPIPDIKANGSDGPLTISSSEALSVTIGLNPGDQGGVNADWWVVAQTPLGWYYYDVIGGVWDWLPGLFVTYQGPLFSFSRFEVLNTTRSLPEMAPGTYDFYFGVDMSMNGMLDFDQLFYDVVRVEVK